jgi:hypothetical protein
MASIAPISRFSLFPKTIHELSLFKNSSMPFDRKNSPFGWFGHSGKNHGIKTIASRIVTITSHSSFFSLPVAFFWQGGLNGQDGTTNDGTVSLRALLPDGTFLPSLRAAISR